MLTNSSYGCCGRQRTRSSSLFRQARSPEPSGAAGHRDAGPDVRMRPHVQHVPALVKDIDHVRSRGLGARSARPSLLLASRDPWPLGHAELDLKPLLLDGPEEARGDTAEAAADTRRSYDSDRARGLSTDGASNIARL